MGRRRGRRALVAGAALAAALAIAPPPAGARAHRAATTSDAVAVYLTTPDGRAQLSRQPDRHFGDGPGAASVTVAVDPARRLQAIRGFGAAFTDSSLWLLSRLPAAQRHAALERLLGAGAGGIGLSVMRVPIGASDFTASGLYSYDDLPPGQTDPSLAHFSIAHDRAYVLPILREALAVHPRLQLLATPWSPPAWMKTNDSLLSLAPTGPGLLRPDAYGPLARYFARFVEAYAAAGVPIWAVTPQNEPLQPTGDYPGMQMTPAEEGAFVADDLAPTLRAAGLPVGIYGYDYVWLGSEAYAAALMAGPAAGDLAGLAYHCYFGAPESMATAAALYPGLDLIEDECSTGISILSPIQVLLRSVENRASTVLMWNAALDPSGGPKVGSGCLSCIGLATVDPAKGSVAWTGDFYELGQASEFVTPGAVHVATTASPAPPPCANAPVCGLEQAAFRDADGRNVLVATNSGTQPVTFAVRRPDGRSFSYSLPGQTAPHGTDNSRDAAVVTFVWGGPATSPPRRARAHRRRAHRRAARRRHAAFTG